MCIRDSLLTAAIRVCPFLTLFCRALPFPTDYILDTPNTYDRSKIRSFALLERLLLSISSTVGRIGFLVTTFPFDTFPQTQTGKWLGQVHGFSFFLNALFTIPVSYTHLDVYKRQHTSSSVWFFAIFFFAAM